MDPDTHTSSIRHIATRSIETYVEWSVTECHPGYRPNYRSFQADSNFIYTGDAASLGPISYRHFHSEGLTAHYDQIPNHAWRLVLPLRGAQAWSVPGGKGVSLSRDYLLVPPGTPFSFACDSAPRDTLLIDIEPGYAQEVIADAAGRSVPSLPPVRPGPHSAQALRPLQNLLLQWRNSLKRPGETHFSQLVADAICRTLVLTAMRDWYPALYRELRSNTVPDRYHPALERAVAYLQAHFTEAVTLDQLAKAAGINKYGLCRLFRKIMGETPIRYLYRLRLERAFQMLRGARPCDQSVTNVALTVGFEDLSHFARLFRAQFGMSPQVVLHATS